MKKILITGRNSYVGNAFEEWIDKYPEKYKAEKVSLREDSWASKDFSDFDTILHVAGIAHVSTDSKMEELYYKVNRDLTMEVAEKAKSEGVKQFIFMSSIIVYGDASSDIRVIDHTTVPTPSNFYGNSKLQAEKALEKMESESFKVVIIRPPMIYGKNSKGNYSKLAKAAQKLPFFPDIDNQRSMLHIDNLCEFIKLMVNNEETGLFFPQNKEYVKTSEMVRLIAKVHGKKIKLTKIFNLILKLKLVVNRINIVNKVFGNIIYSKTISDYKENYQIRNLKRSIELSELESED